MSKGRRYRRWRGCEVKQAYATEAAAQAEIRLAEYMMRGRDPTIKAYECTFCLCWHIGHGKKSDDEDRGHRNDEDRDHADDEAMDEDQ